MDAQYNKPGKYEVRVITPTMEVNLTMEDESDIDILKTLFSAIENKVKASKYENSGSTSTASFDKADKEQEKTIKAEVNLRVDGKPAISL